MLFMNLYLVKFPDDTSTLYVYVQYLLLYCFKEATRSETAVEINCSYFQKERTTQ